MGFYKKLILTNVHKEFEDLKPRYHRDRVVENKMQVQKIIFQANNFRNHKKGPLRDH